MYNMYELHLCNKNKRKVCNRLNLVYIYIHFKSVIKIFLLKGKVKA